VEAVRVLRAVVRPAVAAAIHRPAAVVRPVAVAAAIAVVAVVVHQIDKKNNHEKIYHNTIDFVRLFWVVCSR
jgi:hypothetical protein